MAAKKRERGWQRWRKDTREAGDGGDRRNKRDAKIKDGQWRQQSGRESMATDGGAFPMDYINMWLSIGLIMFQ